MLCHIFSATNFIGNLVNESEAGICRWGDIKNIEQKKFILGFFEIAKLTEKSKRHFFTELTFNR